MKTKIILHEKRIKIYFREGKHFVMYNTGIPVLSLSELYRNDPNNLFKPISQEYIEFNSRIKNIQELIEKIIDDNQWKLGITINNEFIKQRIGVTHNNKDYTKKTLLEYYKDFLTQKISYYEENKFSRLSYKDYTSLLQSLIDYHLTKNLIFNIEDLNYDWVTSFLSFLTSRHSKFVLKSNIDEKLISIIQTLIGKEGERNYKLRFSEDKVKLLTIGELSDNTLLKRFDSLQEFIKYLYKVKIISWFPSEISDLRKLYKAYSPSFTTLTKDELKNLYEFKIDFDHDDHRYEYVRDVFIFMALTGFRFSDVLALDKKMNIRGDKIVKYPQKTEKFDAVAIISIQPVVRLLLEKCISPLIHRTKL